MVHIIICKIEPPRTEDCYNIVTALCKRHYLEDNKKVKKAIKDSFSSITAVISPNKMEVVVFCYYILILRGREGGCGLRSIFTFLLFLMEGNVSYRELFSEWKKIVPSQSYRILKSRKYIQLLWARELLSRCDSLKINFKIYLSLQFLR